MNDKSIVRIWDLPVRLGHWLLAASITLAWLTSEAESWRLVHIGAGCLAGAVVIFRLVWALLGSPPARFAGLLKPPRQALRELRADLAGRPEPRSTHTAVGGWVALAMLLSSLGAAASGLLGYRFDQIEAITEVHEAIAEALLLLIGVHLAGVAAMSWVEHFNLPRSMLDGKRPARAAELVAPHRLAGLTLLVWGAGCAVLGVYWARNLV